LLPRLRNKAKLEMRGFLSRLYTLPGDAPDSENTEHH
jgi:hypothetical protein